MCHGNASPEYFFNRVGRVKLEIGLRKGRQAMQAKELPLFHKVAATSFAGMRKSKVQQRLFYGMQECHPVSKIPEGMHVPWVKIPFENVFSQGQGDAQPVAYLAMITL